MLLDVRVIFHSVQVGIQTRIPSAYVFCVKVEKSSLMQFVSLLEVYVPSEISNV